MPGHDISEEYEYEWKWNGATEERMKTLMLGYHIRTEMRLTHRTIQFYTVLYTEEQEHWVFVWEHVHIHIHLVWLFFGGEKEKKKVWVHNTASGVVGEGQNVALNGCRSWRGRLGL